MTNRANSLVSGDVRKLKLSSPNQSDRLRIKVKVIRCTTTLMARRQMRNRRIWIEMFESKCLNRSVWMFECWWRDANRSAWIEWIEMFEFKGLKLLERKFQAVQQIDLIRLKVAELEFLIFSSLTSSVWVFGEVDSDQFSVRNPGVERPPDGMCRQAVGFLTFESDETVATREPFQKSRCWKSLTCC